MLTPVDGAVHADSAAHTVPVSVLLERGIQDFFLIEDVLDLLLKSIHLTSGFFSPLPDTEKLGLSCAGVLLLRLSLPDPWVFGRSIGGRETGARP